MVKKSSDLSTTGNPSRKRAGRPQKIEKLPGQLDFNFEKVLDSIAKSEDARGTISAMLASRNQKGKHWRGVLAVPPGSIIEMIISEFYQKTNLPLEIPFFVTMSYLSGYLLKNNIHIQSDMGRIDPDIWTVVLAPSGGGKTYTQKKIKEGLGKLLSDSEVNATGVASAAAFVEVLSTCPRGLWIRDEFAQLISSINIEGGPLAELKDILLRTHDNETIERKTKKETITVENPAISILGLTVSDTFSKHVSTEMMLDGFAQRFSYVWAEADPSRPFIEYPIWKVDSSKWYEKWSEIEKNLKPVYYAAEDAEESFSAAFNILYANGLPESFYRRILWRANKYALLYHILIGDTSDRLTPADYGWAARAISLHIDDAAKLIGDHGLSELERMIQAAERIAQKVHYEENRPLKARDLIRGMSAIKNVAQANSLISVMNLGRPNFA